MEPSSPTSINDGSPVVRGNLPLTLAQSFDRLRLNIGKGWLNDVRIQREVIVFIADECGFDLNEYVDPTNSDFALGPILERAREKYIPFMSSTRTIRRWFMFFLEHRVTMAERRKEFFVRRRRCARRGSKQKHRLYFNDMDIDALKW